MLFPVRCICYLLYTVSGTKSRLRLEKVFRAWYALGMSVLDNLPDPMTTKEAAEFLGKSPRWVRHLITKGVMPADQRGRDWLITRDAVLAEMRRPRYKRAK